MRTRKSDLKFLISPNAFKECLSASDVAESLGAGLRRLFPPENIKYLPVADGGDGSLEVLAQNLNLELVPVSTRDPLGRSVDTSIGISGNKSAYIEMASASGLHLLNEAEKNAGRADSYGTGLLIKAALEMHVKEINLFVGGTATMDGGTGILRALGYQFTDVNGRSVPPGGKNLQLIKSIVQPGEEMVKNLEKTRFRIFCDVDNPLTGPLGSVSVFARQKDSGKTNMEELEYSFEAYAGFLRDVKGSDPAIINGAGAAGGTPAGLSAFLNAEILKGADKILDLCGFDDMVSEADYIITGEGKLDIQSFKGKAPIIVAEKAKNQNKKVIFVGGSIPSDQYLKASEYFEAIFSIVPGPVTLQESIIHASKWIERTGYQIGRLLI